MSDFGTSINNINLMQEGEASSISRLQQDIKNNKKRAPENLALLLLL
jgi:hypothetical protein